MTHCSYLNIYISRKFGLCVIDLKGKFQSNLQAKLLNFLVWKFRSIILNFLLFLQDFPNLVLFACCHCYSKELKYLNCDLKQCDGSNNVQKALDLTISEKIWRKMSMIDLNFQTKKLRSLACRLVWNLPSTCKSTIQNLIFRVLCY